MKVDAKLALKPEVFDLMKELARCGVPEFKALSIGYLMRKLKCTASRAKQYLDIHNRAS
jgi:hypothetical protein